MIGEVRPEYRPSGDCRIGSMVRQVLMPCYAEHRRVAPGCRYAACSLIIEIHGNARTCQLRGLRLEHSIADCRQQVEDRREVAAFAPPAAGSSRPAVVMFGETMPEGETRTGVHGGGNLRSVYRRRHVAGCRSCQSICRLRPNRNGWKTCHHQWRGNAA